MGLKALIDQHLASENMDNCIKWGCTDGLTASLNCDSLSHRTLGRQCNLKQQLKLYLWGPWKQRSSLLLHFPQVFSLFDVHAAEIHNRMNSFHGKWYRHSVCTIEHWWSDDRGSFSSIFLDSEQIRELTLSKCVNLEGCFPGRSKLYQQA